MAEFDTLLSDARVLSASDTRVELSLSASAEVVRDLAARESECCSFFTFTVSTDPVVLTIEVPPAYTEVLKALVSP